MSPVSPIFHIIENTEIVHFLSAFLHNCFLCWDRWNSDVMPTLDAALLSSKVGSDLGQGSGLV